MGHPSSEGPGNMRILADQAVMARQTLRPKEDLAVGGEGRGESWGGGGLGGGSGEGGMGRGKGGRYDHHGAGKSWVLLSMQHALCAFSWAGHAHSSKPSMEGYRIKPA